MASAEEQASWIGALDVAEARALRAYRLQRLLAEMRARDLPALVLADPVNIRYATGARNMAVWTLHNGGRYAVVTADGHLALHEYGAAKHLPLGLETVQEIRSGWAWDYWAAGQRGPEMAAAWAGDLLAWLRSKLGHKPDRLGLDRGDTLAVKALEREGVMALDAKPAVETARLIKSPKEIASLGRALAVTRRAVEATRAALQPGMTEAQAFALLVQGVMADGGEFPETRLLSSGPRTNPWFQEASSRRMERGDLISFDTDVIGPGGWYCDFSRSWTVGESKPTDRQRRLYALAREQLDHNSALLKAGLSFKEFGERAFVLPEAYRANRYADVAHGCGLGVEYPLIYYPEDYDFGAYDGHFQAGMVICLESYIGETGGPEGLKLEQTYLVTDSGCTLLTDHPLEESWA